MPEGTIYTLLALDVGDKRIGVARASSLARLPQPVGVIPVDGYEMERIKQMINTEGATVLVVGLPRNLDGQDTEQTRKVREFVKVLQSQLDITIELQDEAGTSKKAESEVSESRHRFGVDELAATYILQDYLGTHL